MVEQKDVSAILALRKKSLDDSNHPITKVVAKYLSQYDFSTERVHDVMDEVCIRAANCTKPINNSEAWFKKVSLNVVREMSRDRERIEFRDSDDYHISEYHDEPSDNEDVMINGFTIDHYSPLLKKAWEESLSPDERFILSVKIWKNKNWREVSEAIAVYNGKLTTETTIRQKGHRAFKKLREAIADLQTTGEPQ